MRRRRFEPAVLVAQHMVFVGAGTDQFALARKRGISVQFVRPCGARILQKVGDFQCTNRRCARNLVRTPMTDRGLLSEAVSAIDLP